ncbi:alkaline phosphatase D family protein [Peribacillus simplex]|uniref:alkaline phosphatase D family protein n=1 Tax=Peribacillus simplex TaxID=1478 RepID=UPI00367106C3
MGGRYAAYRDMAQGDFDYVFHLRDYIYEKNPCRFLYLHALYKLHQTYRLPMQRLRLL